MSWSKWFGGAPVRRPTSRHSARREPLTRRAFLGGGAAVIGLPYLVSLMPRDARAVAATDPVRLARIFRGAGATDLPPVEQLAGIAVPSARPTTTSSPSDRPSII